jgi:predicted nucleic acid-binding protein
MIVLDTNVVSEMMKPEPDARVRAWLDAQPAETVFLTSITLAELLYGVAAMPAGKRQVRLRLFVDELTERLASNVLSFDLAAAQEHARLAVRARRSGHGFPVPNGYIAAIAAAHGYAVATRDSAPFEAAGLVVINPWST